MKVITGVSSVIIYSHNSDGKKSRERTLDGKSLRIRARITGS